jgi:hypothetical protein
LFKEVPTYKLITPSVLVDRLRVNGSLARVAIRELEEKGLIRKISTHGSQLIYSTFYFILFIYLIFIFNFFTLLMRYSSLFFYKKKFIARATAAMDKPES